MVEFLLSKRKYVEIEVGLVMMSDQLQLLVSIGFEVLQEPLFVLRL